MIAGKEDELLVTLHSGQKGWIPRGDRGWLPRGGVIDVSEREVEELRKEGGGERKEFPRRQRDREDEAKEEEARFVAGAKTVAQFVEEQKRRRFLTREKAEGIQRTIREVWRMRKIGEEKFPDQWSYLPEDDEGGRSPRGGEGPPKRLRRSGMSRERSSERGEDEV